MGQALLTKGCTKDLLERLKVLYELAGLPGKAPGLDHSRGRQLLKNQNGAHALGTNLPPAASPGARARLGLLSSSWKCVAVHRAAPLLPAALQGPSSAAGTPKGWFVVVYFGHHPALLVRCCCSCCPLQLQPGAAALWPAEVSKVGVGSSALPSALAGHHPRAPLAPIPGTCSGRGGVLLLGSAAVARALIVGMCPL